MTSRRTKISPKSGRGLAHVTSTIFGSTVGYPSDSLASCSCLTRHVNYGLRVEVEVFLKNTERRLRTKHRAWAVSDS